jgi:hypothetical protein
MSLVSHVTNPTNIQKIFKSNISFEVFDDSHGQRNFIIHELFLANLDLPGDAQVYCVPKAHDAEKPVSLGQVGNLKNIGEILPIEGLSSNAPLKFRFLIVDYDTSMILASAENMRAKSPDEDGFDALLPVNVRDLGSLIWRMELTPDDDPLLELNKNYLGIAEKLRTDVEYQALIIPEAVRQVLIHLVENNSDPDPENWVQKWIRWLSDLGFKDIPEEDETSSKDIEEWAEKVVQKFSKKYELFERTKQKLFNDEESK